MSRTGRVLPWSVLAAAMLLAACAPAPTPAPAASNPPAVAPAPACAATSTTAAQEPTDTTSTADTTGDVVLVAVDDQGRPEIVTTEPQDAAAVVQDLESEPGVEVVALEVDQEMRSGAMGGDPYRAQQWALDDLRAETAWASSTGSGVDIAVVDTGVAASHADLAGRYCTGVAFLGSNGVAQIGGGTSDPNGHGTHVAGIALAGSGDSVGIAGVAPASRLIPVRVLDAAGSGSSSDVARGIIWAVDHGAEIVNLSLGGPATAAVASAVAYAEQHGVLVVAAAGNDGPTGPANYPAALDTALAVASYDEGGSLSWFSTRGAYVDVAAPGSGIVSTYRDGRWTYMSGTSMATPHVAGVAALLLAEDPGLSPAQLRTRISSTASEAGPIGFDTGYGWGHIDPVAALAG